MIYSNRRALTVFSISLMFLLGFGYSFCEASTVEWTRNFGGANLDQFRSVHETSDGGYILAGFERSWGNGDFDGWVVKLDSNGNREWVKNFGGAGEDKFYSVQQTSDGGYILAGSEGSWGNGSSDGWVVKLDSNGNRQWSRNFGGADADGFYSVQQTSDGGYILAGFERSWGDGSLDGWVVKLH